MSDENKEAEAVPVSIDDLPTGEEQADALRAAFVNYARKDTVYNSGGKLYGNWSPSFSGACSAAFSTYIEAGGISELVEVGNCSSGARVMRATS